MERGRGIVIWNEGYVYGRGRGAALGVLQHETVALDTRSVDDKQRLSQY